MKYISNGHDLLIALKNDEDFILDHNLYELYFESNWRTLITDDLIEYKKSHIILKGDPYEET